MVEVDAAEVVDLGGRVKVPRGVVVFCGDRDGAAQYILDHGGQGRAVAHARVSVGDYYTATAGDWGTATAGDDGTAMAGVRGTAVAGYLGTATAGVEGTLLLEWSDSGRRRVVVGYLGEDGIEPDVAYQVKNGVLVPAEGSK